MDHCVIDLSRDQSGTTALCVTRRHGDTQTSDLLTIQLDVSTQTMCRILHERMPSGPIVCFDSRALLDLGVPSDRLIDLRLAFDARTLSRAAKRLTGCVSLARDHLEAEQALRSHARAAAAAQVDLTRAPLFDMVPHGQLARAFELRASVMFALAKQFPELIELAKSQSHMVKVLRHMELSGVRIDSELVKSRLDAGGLPAHESQFYRAALSCAGRSGIAYTKYSPVGIKTGRTKVEDGLNTMTVPKGACREAIVSRWEDGEVCSFDFNAIDYRCIVASVPEVAQLYLDCDDFHVRTRSLCDLNFMTREQVKLGTYVYVYGGSMETCMQRTGLDEESTYRLMAAIDSNLRPVMKFRQTLHEKAQLDGFVVTPSGHRVSVESDDHPGKVLGLYAQSYSSGVFGRALAEAVAYSEDNGLMSRVMFTVHDELVVDLHPDESMNFLNFRDVMLGEVGIEFAIKCGRGKNYREATK